MEEEWRDITGYEGLYMVSNKGRVKSLRRTARTIGNGKRLVPERILKAGIWGRGYCHVSLMKNGKLKSYKVHRLVASAFISNPNNKPFVNHLNEVRTDNNVRNLEWSTCSENLKYTYKRDLRKRNTWDKNKMSKLDEFKVLTCYTLSAVMSDKEIAGIYNIRRQTINSLLNGKTYMRMKFR